MISNASFDSVVPTGAMCTFDPARDTRPVDVLRVTGGHSRMVGMGLLRNIPHKWSVERMRCGAVRRRSCERMDSAGRLHAEQSPGQSTTGHGVMSRLTCLSSTEPQPWGPYTWESSMCVPLENVTRAVLAGQC